MEGNKTNKTVKTMEKVVALAKNRGFVFPGSEIYGDWQIPGIMVL